MNQVFLSITYHYLYIYDKMNLEKLFPVNDSFE